MLSSFPFNIFWKMDIKTEFMVTIAPFLTQTFFSKKAAIAPFTQDERNFIQPRI